MHNTLVVPPLYPSGRTLWRTIEDDHVDGRTQIGKAIPRRIARLAWGWRLVLHPGIDQGAAEILLQPRLENKILAGQNVHWSCATLAP